MKKQRGNYEEYLALEELYNTLKIEAFPIRNMHPEQLVELLNEYADRALQEKQQNPNDLNIKLTGVDPKSDARLNSLPLLKVWGEKPRDKVMLTECLMGFYRSLKTPNILELEPNYSGWYTRKDEKYVYTPVEYEEDDFEIYTEVSDDRPWSLTNPLPAHYSISSWSMKGHKASLGWIDMTGIFFDRVEMSDQGSIVEFLTERREEDGITNYLYAVTSYLKPMNDYKPDAFAAYGSLTLTNRSKFQSIFKAHQFKEESKWIDYSVAPGLSREEIIQKVTEYLKSDFNVMGQIVRNRVILRRARFTDYWIYEVNLYYDYSQECNVANIITAHVLLSGDVVPFVKDED